MQKSDLIALIQRMDVHQVILEVVEHADTGDGDDPSESAINDLVYLKEEIGRVLRQIEFQNS